MGSSKSKDKQAGSLREERRPAGEEPTFVTPKHVGHFSLLPARLARLDEDIGMGNLSFIPTEIKIQVLKYLEVQDILILSSCSMSLFDLCSADYIWKDIFSSIDNAYREHRIIRHCCWKRRTILSYVIFPLPLVFPFSESQFSRQNTF
jgi:hypothetical protein